MNETFRLTRATKYLGMTMSAIFLTAVVLSLGMLFLEDPARHGFHRTHSREIVVGLSVALYGTMLLGSIYLWRSFYVERFTIDGTTLWVRSMFQDHRFDVSELTRLHWKIRPISGKLRFETCGTHSVLDLGGYSTADRLRIIRILSELVPETVQENWPAFCHKIALPLRDGPRSRLRIDPQLKTVKITRQRYDRMAAIAIPLSAVAAVAIGVIWGVWTFLATPVLLVGAWLLLRSSVSPRGEIHVHHSSVIPGNAGPITVGAIVSSLVVMSGLKLCGVDKNTACWAGLAIMGPALPYIIYMGHKADQQRWKRDELAAPFVHDLWKEGNEQACIPSAQRSDFEV
ncbi:MAG TPA: hypothetical protein VM452_16400 [Caulifigura sp.]|nr:hypothetical protein [Caulifigura sp.]